MDPPISSKSPVLECILQDPAKHEDAGKGEISDKSGEDANEEREHEEEGKTEEPENSFSPTTTPIPESTQTSTPAPTPTFTPARTSTPTSTPTPTPTPTPAPTSTPTQALTSTSSPAPVPISASTPAQSPGKVTRLQQVRQGIVHPQVASINFWSIKLFPSFLKESKQTFFVFSLKDLDKMYQYCQLRLRGRCLSHFLQKNLPRFKTKIFDQNR